MKPSRFLVPFCLGSLLFLAMVLLMILHGLHRDAGVFVYPLDDSYIHLSVARNLALHSVWGITPHEFSGASSSPGWTLLLAGIIKLTGVHLLTPLVVNLIAGLLLLLTASIILAKALPRAGIGFISCTLFALVLVVPLPGLAVIGMEHVLHSLAALCFVAAGAWVAHLRKADSVPPATCAALLVAAAACGALRYESCFMVLIIAAVLLLRKRTGLAILVCVAAAIGPLAYAVFSYQESHLLLPFSVLMKSADSRPADPWSALLESSVSPIVMFLGSALLLSFARRLGRPVSEREPFWTFARTFAIIVLVTASIQAVLGPTGWLMRYESYLFALGVVAFALIAGKEIESFPVNGPLLVPAHRWVAVAFIFAMLPATLDVLHRAHHGWSDVSASIHDRYVEHLPQALFVEQTMPNAVIFAHDIGFLAYYAPEVRILDPLGLGSIEPVELERRHQTVTTDFIRQWTAKEHAQFGIMHTDFPGSVMPSNWILVESCCFPDNVVFFKSCGELLRAQ